MNYRIKARSIMGHAVWITNVSEPVETGEGMAPIVSAVNRQAKGKLFTREEAEAVLPAVRETHPDAELELVE